MRGSKLLINERQLQVLPTLAVRLGLNEAIAVQQLHFALGTFESRVVDVDGAQWLRADLEWWQQQFPWWSDTTIRRIWTNLRQLGIVLTSRGREANVYRIDYARLDAHCGLPDSPDAAIQSGQDGRSPSIGEGTAENTEEELTLPGLAPPAEPSAAPPSPAPADDSKVEDVWAEYERVFAGRFTKGLTDPKRKTIRKALKAVDDDAAICKRAIHGLKFYRDTHPAGSKDVGLSVIFETGPHSGRNLTEQIEWWASQAEGDNAGSAKSGINAEVPAVLHDRIVRRRISVVEMLQSPDNAAVRERGEEALAWLREHAGEEPVITDGKVDAWLKIR